MRVFERFKRVFDSAQYTVKHVEALESGSNWWVSFDYGGGLGGEVSGKGPCVVIVLEQKEEK